jgi:hypothetical protein
MIEKRIRVEEKAAEPVSSTADEDVGW